MRLENSRLTSNDRKNNILHNHAWSRSKALYTGFDYNKNKNYNDYVTTKTGTTELKIVDELKGDGTEVNRTEDKVNGTVYILNQASGFKLSGKEKPMTLTQLANSKHVNSDNSPWWIARQSQCSYPTYIDLQISYNQIRVDTRQLQGILSFDINKVATINTDIDKITDFLFDTVTLNPKNR